MPSSYFSPPSDHLDPALFDGDKLKSDIRQPLITAAVESLKGAGLNNPQSWLHMWLTGSAISYQWQADRGNGDLDIQLGINYQKFLTDNPGYAHGSESLINMQINRYLHDTLWVNMSKAQLDGKIFEVTFFWNYEVEDDIMAINPYAAYDLMEDKWIVHPPLLPADPKTLYPEEWFKTAGNDTTATRRIQAEYESISSQTGINAESRRKLLEAQAKSLYNDMHAGRREAFSGQGKGYYDWHNFRWQAAKDSGALETLKDIIGISIRNQQHTNTELYGGEIKSADEALSEAMNLRMGTRYDASI